MSPPASRSAVNRGMDAYLRRNCQILRSIGVHHPSARLFDGSTDLGYWKDALADVCVRQRRLWIRLRIPPFLQPCAVNAVRFWPGGAWVRLTCRRGASRNPLKIVWGRASCDDMTAGDDTVRCLSSWACATYPGWRAVSLSCHTDRRHSLSGDFVRLHLSCKGSDLLLFAPTGIAAERSGRTILSQALLWMSHARRTGAISGASWIHLFVPKGEAALPMHRLKFMSPELVRARIWEYTSSCDGGWEVSSPEPMKAAKEGRDYTWPVHGPRQRSEVVDRVMDLAPSLVRLHPRCREYDSLRLHGLEFARAYGVARDRICFGVGSAARELDDGNFKDLEDLVRQILYYRRPDSPDLRHPLFRLQAERWMESLILEERERLFPELFPEDFYPQVPLYLGDLTGRADLLALHRDGRLVVVELKCSPDIDLPLQALDYWGRVLEHNLRGDFERRGYFTARPVARNLPRIYLVAPVFAFHDTTERLLAYLRSDLEVWKISVNEGWRSGIRILRQHRCR